MGSPAGDLRVCVLGPTVVERSGRTLPIGGRLPRRLLTVLAAADSAPVGVDRLVQAMWSDAAPARADSSVHAYVSRLRQVLDGGSRTGSLLGYHDQHYRLLLPPGARDVDEADRLLRHAESAAADAALTLVERALALRRGQPYADGGADPDDLVAAARVAWEERLAAAEERRLAALLDLGRTELAVAELRRRVHDHPLRERGWELLVLGLYRSGRQADALAACRELRHILDAELGIRPGPTLRDLETAVLRQDPRLLWGQRTVITARREPLVGRAAELRLLDQLIADHRLVTVHGPAGVGKTRLVREWAATAAIPEIWFASLKSDGDATSVAATMARALGLQQLVTDPVAMITTALTGRSGVMIIDNCEHVRGQVAAVVGSLLDRCPSITVLATSREPLDLAAEIILPLSPLPTGHPSDAAVELLVQLISTPRPSWTPSAADRHQLLRLARRLDGLPLALELAAARSRAQSLSELVDSADELTALDTTIDWSIGLLTAPQRDLLIRLWPFVGGFTADTLDDALEIDSLPLLADLVAKSVVVADTEASPTRYWLLETVRARCRRLDPDPAGSRLALARWVRRFAWETDARMCDARSASTTRRLYADVPNIDAALAYDLEISPVDALRTVTELNCWWLRTAQGVALLRWLDAALAAAPDAPTGLLTKAHLLRGIALTLTGQESAARAEVELTQRLLDDLDTADPDRDHVRGELPYLRSLLATMGGDPTTGRRYAEECVRVTTELGTCWLEATAQTTIATHDLLRGDLDSAFARLDLALRQSHAIGMRWGLGTAGRALAIAYLAAHRPAEALASARAALQHSRDDADAFTSISGCVVIARSLAALGDVWSAAVLLDGIRGWAARTALRWDAVEAATLGDLEDVLDRALPPDRRRTADTSAAALDFDALLALAQSPPDPAVRPRWQPADVRVPPRLTVAG